MLTMLKSLISVRSIHGFTPLQETMDLLRVFLEPQWCLDGSAFGGWEACGGRYWEET